MEELADEIMTTNPLKVKPNGMVKASVELFTQKFTPESLPG
jgi:hypothetical protein